MSNRAAPAVALIQRAVDATGTDRGQVLRAFLRRANRMATLDSIVPSVFDFRFPTNPTQDEMNGWSTELLVVIREAGH